MLELGTNPLSAISTVRQPRGIVTINGINLPFESFEVDNNTYYVADTFRVEIPSNGLPASLTSIVLSFSSQIIVDIWTGFPDSTDIFSNDGFSELIYGEVDDFSFDPAKGTITLSGRDLTSRFIDNKTTEKFVNLTSSQIATQLATRRGLTPVVTSTSVKVGKYYEIDQSRLTKEMSEWDLLTYLAREENFIVYVKGQSLYFIPEPTEAQLPYVIQFNQLSQDIFSNTIPTTNVIDLKLSRNLTLAGDVAVQVRSWNQKTGKAYTKTATSKHINLQKAQATGKVQNYVYTFPNLTPEQATQKAQQLLKDISKHEMKLRAVMPADNTLDKSQIIRLTGTGTAWDQIYFPDSIVREFSFHSGYSMTIEAKNHSPNSQTIA